MPGVGGSPRRSTRVTAPPSGCPREAVGRAQCRDCPVFSGARPRPYPLPAAVRMRPGSTVSHSFPSRLHFRRLSFRPPPAVTSFSTSMYMEGSELTWGRQDNTLQWSWPQTWAPGVDRAASHQAGVSRAGHGHRCRERVTTGPPPMEWTRWVKLMTETSGSCHPRSGGRKQRPQVTCQAHAVRKGPGSRAEPGTTALPTGNLQRLWGVAGAEAARLLEEVWEDRGAQRAH